MSEPEKKLLFRHGPNYYVALEDVQAVLSCGPKTAKAIWSKLPFVSMEEVMEYKYQEKKKSRLYRMTLVMMTLAPVPM